jgi:VCBS repeat-containing protein
VNITVNAVNDPPVASNDSYSTDEDQTLNVSAPGVLGNDSDVEDDPLSAVKVSDPSHGSVTLNSNGSFSYTPDAGYSGSDWFTYKANDGTADSNTATVNITITADAPPAAPTGLTATPGDGQVSLDWNDNSEPDLANYRVYRSTTSGSGYGQIASPSSSAYTDNGVANGTTYYYVVTVVDAGSNESGYSGEVSATPASAGAGTGLKGEYYDNMDFTSLAVTRVDPTVGFDWGSGAPDPSMGADTFSVRWTGKIEPLYSETYTFRTYTDDGIRLWVDSQLVVENWTDHGPTSNTGTISLTAAVQYDIQLDFYENGGGAVCQLYWSSASQSEEIVPQSQLYEPVGDTTPPADPTGLSATPGDGQVSLDWADNSEPDLSGYRVYRSTTSGSGYSQIASPGSSAYTDSGVTNGTTYYYVVTAVDTASNESGYSNEASATPTDSTPPAAPSGLSATAGDGQVSLDWNDNSEPDLANYRVYRSTTSGSGYSQIASPGSSAYTDSGVTNGTTYYYVVTALDTASNESGYSNEASATPQAGVGGTTTYNFAGVTQSTPGYDAYACDVDVFPFGGSTSNRNSQVEATDTQYGNISADNTAQWATADPGSRDEILLWLEMEIDEPVGNITQIDLTFNGNTDGSSATEHRIYVMTAGANWAQSASWTQVGTGQSIPQDVDTTMTRSITSNIGNYIDGSGKIVWGVYETRSSEDLRINYVEMVVHYSGTPDTTPPADPTGLGATAGDAQVSVDWNDNGEGDLDGYRVYRSTTSGSGYGQIADVSSSSHTDTGVSNGTTYYYVVTAYDTSDNESGYSNEASATPQGDTTPPADPTGLGATAGDAQVSLDWNDNGEGDLDGYRVYRSTTSGSGYGQIADVSSSAHTDSGVSNGTTYYYVVTAYDTSDNESGYSNEASATPQGDTTPPAAPTGLGATAGDGEVDLDWNDNTEGDLSGYRVYRSTTSGSGYSQIASPSSSACTDTGVTNGTTYYYVVTAVDTSSNESGYSNEASATPQDVTAPAAPTGLTATAGDGQVSLDWNDNGEPDLDSYRVYRSTTSGSGHSQIASPSASSHTDSGLTNGTTYYYVVTAVDTASNESGYSSEASATPQSGGGAVFQEGDFPSIQDSATFTAGTTPLEVVITHSHENPDNIAVREPTGGNPDAWLQLGAYRSISWIGLTSPAGGQEWAISFDWKYDPSTGWMEPKFQVVGMTNGQTRNAPAGINAPTGDGVVLHQTVLPESQPTWVDSSRNLTIPAGYDVILLEWWTDAAASGEYGVDNVSVTTGG